MIGDRPRRDGGGASSPRSYSSSPPKRREVSGLQMPIQKKLRFAGIDDEDTVLLETDADDSPGIEPQTMSPTEHTSVSSENSPTNSVDASQAFDAFENMRIIDTETAKRVASLKAVSGCSEEDMTSCAPSKAKMESPIFQDVNLESMSEKQWEIDMLGGRKSFEYIVSKNGTDLGIHVCDMSRLLRVRRLTVSVTLF